MDAATAGWRWQSTEISRVVFGLLGNLQFDFLIRSGIRFPGTVVPELQKHRGADAKAHAGRLKPGMV